MPHLITPVSPNRSSDAAPVWLVTCLCAAWCGTCNNYEDTIARVAQQLQDSMSEKIEFAWVDIEDDSDWLGEIDVENFPTVIITTHSDEKSEGRDALHFFGTILPQPEHLTRLVRNVIEKNDEIKAPADQQFAASQIGAFVRSNKAPTD